MNESHTVTGLSPLRKVIAARMSDANKSIPHFRLIVDIEMDALLALRDEENAAVSGARISVNDCIIKASAAALSEHPSVNIQFIDSSIHQFRSADISVVIAVDGGLVTPVVRTADQKTVREIAAEVKSLSARAASKQIKVEEMLGGSFSISNLGGYGIDQFDAIINPPQCSILAVGRAKPQVTVSDTRDIRIATLLRATLSVDHRTIDGAVAAAFLTTLRMKLEQPRDLFSATVPCR